MKKRRQETHKNGECEDDAKKQKTNHRSQEEWLKASTIPLWDVPYDKQVSSCIVLLTYEGFGRASVSARVYKHTEFDVFSTVHHSIGLFLQPTSMRKSITTCMSHYYPRHVSGLDMPILRRNNCTNTASGNLALTSGCTLHRLREV